MKKWVIFLKKGFFFQKKDSFKQHTSLIDQVVLYYGYTSIVKQYIYWKTGVGGKPTRYSQHGSDDG